MAENLGEAQLRLTVDTGAVDKQLKRLRDAIQNFAPDFKAVKAGLRAVTTEAKAASDSAKSLAFNLNQVPSSKLEGLSKQIKTLQTNLRGARIQSEDFLNALTRIQELEGLRDIRVGRQSVLAGQQAYSPTGAMGQLNQAQLPQLPLTLAGERQNIDELKRKLSNLDYESAAYAETLRVLQRAQERYNNILNGTSSEYQKLAQQEEAAIRRAEKLAGIQSYYADRNPRAGGVRDESGAMLARGAGSVADERAYQAALRPARELLDTDLKRAQVLRQISQRILATAQASEGGFGAASASNFGTTDPVTKSIRRNAERSAQRLERLTAQRDALESDLVDVQARRVKTETARAELADKLLAAERSGSSGGGPQGSLGRGASRLRQNLPDAFSSALIGGAFPALFGQGAGASVGGALGGALGIFGGGFGFAGSLIGTSIGQQADNLGKLSQALQDPIGRFQELQQAAVLSSRSLEKNIEALINAGRYAEAEAKIREDLAKRGLDAATANQLAAETDKLQRSLAELGLSIGLVVQGPLTDLINGFNRLLQPGRVAAQSRAIQGGLSPEDQTAYQNRRRELNRGGLGIVDANEQANEEFASRTRDALKAQEQLTAAQTKDNALLTAKYRLIDATTQGYERLTLERQKELLIEERNAQLRATPNEGLRIEQETAQRLYEINQQIQRLDQKRWSESIAAANQLKSIQEEIAIQQQRGSLTGTGIGALQAVKQLEDAKRAEQDAQAALRADPGSSDLLNASKLASENVKLAAAKTKADLQDAFKSAQDAVQSISRGIEDSVTALRELQNSSGGLNQFLSPQQQVNRQQAIADQLRPEAQALANQLGIRLQVSGTTQQRNQQTLDFINAARQELRLGQDIDRAQVDLGKATNDLAVVNDSLVTVNTQLTEATSALAQKDWQVNVAVNANTGEFAVNLG